LGLVSSSSLVSIHSIIAAATGGRLLRQKRGGRRRGVIVGLSIDGDTKNRLFVVEI